MRKTRQTLTVLGLVVLTAGSVAMSAQRGQDQGQRGRGSYNQMSGTYNLDNARGDDAQRAASQATRNLPPQQRDRAYQNLLNRLQPPTSLAIDRQGNRVMISSSHGPRTEFDVDGRVRNEPGPYGRQVTTLAQFQGNKLSVTTTGDRNSSFLVVFEPLNNGDVLFVTRRMDSDDLRGPVTIRSYYHRSAPEPQWDVYGGGGYRDRGYIAPPPRPEPRPRPFTLQEGTRIGAVLDTQIDTRNMRGGERFSMTVDSPMEYRGARIDGTIARVNQYSQGHNADMYVDFDTMRLRDGQTSEFDAVLNTVRTPNGATFRVDSSGTGRDTHNEAVQQGAIGAALGAVIGAIAGGGKGAAIGAVVGGAGGAILAQDRDQYLSLPPGTQVSIIVTSPRSR